MVSAMVTRQTGSMQRALEVRHDVEALAERCRRLYEEANELVERLRKLDSSEPTSRRSIPGGSIRPACPRKRGRSAGHSTEWSAAPRGLPAGA